ncbi:MAG: hypothetical protein L0212_00905 [Acidobacteria bacterium]|nr:hypothetical protein [Acidobacteriota bacterium]
MAFCIALLPDIFPWVWNWWHGILSGAAVGLVVLIVVMAVFRMSPSTFPGISLVTFGTVTANALVRWVGGYLTGVRAGFGDVLLWSVYGGAGFYAFLFAVGLPVQLVAVLLALLPNSEKSGSAAGPTKPPEPPPKANSSPPGTAP